MTKCPICESKLKFTGDRDEYYETCENGCYHYEFVYGSGIFAIFDKEFDHHYTDSCERIIRRNNEIETLTKYWKENDRYLGQIMVK